MNETYKPEDVTKLLEGIEAIQCPNEKSAVASFMWWNYFSGQYQPRSPELKIIKDGLPYPQDEITNLRMQELVSDFPDVFKGKISGFAPPEEGSRKSKAKHANPAGKKVSYQHPYEVCAPENSGAQFRRMLEMGWNY